MIKKYTVNKSKVYKYQLGGYTVQKGDTLSHIAQRFTGKASNYKDLAEINKLADANKIVPGQVLYIPKKISQPLKKGDIPTSNKTVVIDNYSPNYDYIVEGDKMYYSKKNTDYWVDISDNEKARQNLYNFLKRYDFKGYENDEKKIAGRINAGTFNYSAYRDSMNAQGVPEGIVPKAIQSTKPRIEIPFKTSFAATSQASNDAIKSQKSNPVQKLIPEEGTWKSSVPLISGTKKSTTTWADKLNSTIELVKNGVKRKVLKELQESTDPISVMNLPESFPQQSQYGIRPSHYTGDTVHYSTLTPKGISKRYYLPESLDLKDMTFGVRNRGDRKPLTTEGGVITSTHAFAPKTSYSDTTRTYIGIDEKGRFKAGKYSNFSNKDLIAPTFVNRITGFDLDEKGNFKFVMGKHGNNKPTPVVNIVDDLKGRTKGSLNLITWGNQGDPKMYGNLTGGRLIISAGDETRLISGSIENVKNEIEALKKRTKSPYVDVYTLDNGSYNLGLRTTDKKISEYQQARYDALNQGGGHFLYIKEKNPLTFPSDTVWTPNVRTELDESYKKGHGLENEQSGVLLHHTAFTEPSLNNVLQYLTKPKGNSSHVVIGYKGERKVLATPNKVTFHAGESMWNNRPNVNDFMIGVEFQGNTNEKPLTEEQINSAVEYLAPIIRQNNISLENITTHKQVRDLYNQFSKQKALSKSDISEKEYGRILEALKKKIYYKL